jgi:predicted nucleic acid-binding protein
VALAYLDTSALGRILLGEPDAAAILAVLPQFDQLVSSRLIRIELRRLASREDVVDDAERLLAGVALIPLDDEILAAAETVPPFTVHSLDAIHLVTALRLRERASLDALLTYDRRLAEGAEHHGIEVMAPA